MRRENEIRALHIRLLDKLKNDELSEERLTTLSSELALLDWILEEFSGQDLDACFVERSLQFVPFKRLTQYTPHHVNRGRKLTPEQVSEIRSLYWDGVIDKSKKITYKALAMRFNVSTTCIQHAITSPTAWRDVELARPTIYYCAKKGREMVKVEYKQYFCQWPLKYEPEYDSPFFVRTRLEEEG